MILRTVSLHCLICAITTSELIYKGATQTIHKRYIPFKITYTIHSFQVLYSSPIHHKEKLNPVFFVHFTLLCSMARILALDYGKKRTGIAVTDPLQIIATALDTVDTNELIGYLKKYIALEPVEKILIGYPLNMDDSPTDATPLVEKFIKKFSNVFPALPVVTVDERMTSRMASQAIAGMGLKKKDRERKELIDSVAAVIILQEYLENRG